MLWTCCRGWVKRRDIFSQKFAISESDSSGAINSDYILVKLFNLDDAASFVPFEGVVADLVLDSDLVADLQWGKTSGVFRESLQGFHMSVGECFFTAYQCFTPCRMWEKAARKDWYKVSNRSSKKALRWRESGVTVRRVAVLQDGSLEVLGVK